VRRSKPTIRVYPTQPFARDSLKLSPEMRRIVQRKLDLFRENPRHPSLRVKKMHGHEEIWELSLTEDYRVTFEWSETQGQERIAILRRVGSHDILKTP
jgi:mRNA-degrading endonuclease RelE of RelBE toxin-antitoxin system